MSTRTAHVDTFARDRLPSRENWPEFLFELPELQYPARLNCGRALLDEAIFEGHGDRIALRTDTQCWTYSELQHKVDRLANVLVTVLGIVPGNRVLLRGTNTPELVAAWLAVMKAGAIAVTTMPLLRTKELSVIIDKAQIKHALCDTRVARELDEVAASSTDTLRILRWGDFDFEALTGASPASFTAVDTAADDVCLLAFTSGTTGRPKATMHFHRDVLAMADVVGRHLLFTRPEDIYLGSAPLGFTFGLGALLVFPLRFRASSALIEKPSAESLLAGVNLHRATCLFTAPTMYRQCVPLVKDHDISSLKRCVSAGEHLSKATSEAWSEATGLRIIDGLGSTEMIHIFISAAGDDIRPGAIGMPLPGYRAMICDAQGRPLPPGSSGLLAVKGPTGCRYLDDSRQSDYVRQGWNFTGDICEMDEQGYYWFQARADDMIVSAGYNIAGLEVEDALILHPGVSECAVIGVADAQRGQIVKAFVVPAKGFMASENLNAELRDFVKRMIAPYKYPREIEFMEALPKTSTGKVERRRLRR